MALLVNPRLQLKTSVENGKLSIPEADSNMKITTDKDSSSLSFTNNTISEENATNTNKIAAILCIAIVVVALYQGVIHGASMASFLRGTSIGTIFLQISAAFVSLAFIELIWRIVLVLMYKPIEGCSDEMLPGCTVIVPAFNEGKQVFVTLQSLAASDYPKEKLQLIAVDDGSVDDTWEWIKKAKEELGDKVITIKQPCNKGKRHALYAGFQQSTGEVLVTVDSDSTVDADTLRNLVSPFVVDKKVGAIAGNVRVLNMDKGIIPKMLDVVFVYSFDFIRASQSVVKAVMCTPGALSAYRRNVVMDILNEWLNQTFCGQPANIGEDRAMTNLILREGYHVLFQQNAKVYTEVPVKYVNLSKMYLRWARSNVRETIAMTRFIFKNFREGSKLGARINLISGWAAITKAQIFLVITWALILLHPMTFGVNAIIGVLVSSSLAAIIYAWKFGTFASLWSFIYGFYFFVALSWIRPYALITPHKAGWLTRQKVAPAASTPTATVQTALTTAIN
ncbi:MAG: glycosyltransferase family 2 protein [Desulfamplus sp.]